MNDRDEPASAGRFETFDANEWFVVVRDDEGYGVWHLDDLEDGDPLERSSDSDEGYESAAGRWRQLSSRHRRGRWLDLMKWVVIVSVVTWVVANAITYTIISLNQSQVFRGGFRNLTASTFFEIMQALTVIGDSFALGSTAVYVVLWLDDRRAQ